MVSAPSTSGWLSCFFFFNDTATTKIYTLSLHDALPIFAGRAFPLLVGCVSIARDRGDHRDRLARADRKSTRLNSSHPSISYAVFCLKKKKKITVLFSIGMGQLRDLFTSTAPARSHHQLP